MTYAQIRALKFAMLDLKCYYRSIGDDINLMLIIERIHQLDTYKPIDRDDTYYSK